MAKNARRLAVASREGKAARRRLAALEPGESERAEPGSLAVRHAGVERFFALLTERQIRRGVHRGIDALHAAIDDVSERRNADPKPFRWTESADGILASAECLSLYNTPSRGMA